ncbi:MAG: hypothetical protein R3361_02320, partial [Aequorivita vladivostokensis]|nr:hypothetical protein [Aequorivita vladivostokensis]
LMSYLENLAYVDFLDDVVVKHRTPETSANIEKTNIIPSSPKAILVSAKKHFITAVQSKCREQNPKKPAICLP